MKHSTYTFSTHDGLQLFGQEWRPKSAAQAHVLMVHGLGEHSSRFGNLVVPMVEHGLWVHSFDLRGHGRSQGRRGHIRAWSDFRKDLRARLRRLESEKRDLPLFLYGHSLGSLIVLEALIREAVEPRGVILSGVALDPDGIGNPLQIVAAQLLSRLWPSFTLDTGLDTEMISSDQKVVMVYEEDPLVHSKATARFATESMHAIERINDNLDRIQPAMLLLHGGKDELTSLKGSERVMERLTVEDKELILYPEARHEPHNDRSQDAVSRDVIRWIMDRSD
ncbi:MAG: lysophospholipase [Anaerolineales bacterium]